MRDDTLIAVTTTTRKGVDYLPNTIAALDANGAGLVACGYRLIHSDGPLGRSFPGWRVFETCHNVGSRLSFWNVLGIAAAMDVDLLAFEDDISMCRNAVAFMLAYEVPPMIAWVSFFDNMTEQSHRPGLKIRSLVSKPFWGVQAVKIPKRCFPDLLADDTDNVKRLMGMMTPGYMGGRDLYLQAKMIESAWPMYGSHFPNVVQHIGGVSVLNGPRAQEYKAKNRERVSTNYPGDDFDASRLL